MLQAQDRLGELLDDRGVEAGAGGEHGVLGRFEHAGPAAVDLPDAPVVREEVDVPEHL